jgi:aspartyl/asparaginyl beta-hydroxylase (cupin superfamily)
MHHVENRCDQVRVILFLDVERPMRWWIGRAFNRAILWGASLFPSKSNATPAMLRPADARSAAAM